MATVTSLTQAKIEELMSGWQGVELSQDEINALVSQLWTDVQGQGVTLQDFSDNVVPLIEAAQAANDIALQDLYTNDLPGLEASITANEASLTNLNTVTLPDLTSRVHTNELWVVDLNDVTLPQLYSDLADNQAALDEFNTITLPALNSDLSSLNGKFPVGSVDIQDGAIVADKIAVDAIVANKIAAGAIVAGKIAADAVTANTIAANAITATKIAAGAVTAGKIAADAITANEIAAGAVTASEIAAGAVTAGKIAADAVTANEIAAGAITVGKIAAGAVTASEIAAGTITAAEINAESLTTAIINTGAIQSQLSITGVLEIDGANMGWSAAAGLYLGSRVRLYGDDRTNQIEGAFVTDNMSVKSGLSISGDADVHGDLVLGNGIVAPSRPVALGQDWPRLPLFGAPDHATDASGIYQGLVEWSSTQWLVAFNYLGAGLRLYGKADLTWDGDLPLAGWATNFYPGGGVTKLGASIYLIGSDSTRNADMYLYRLTSSGTIAKTSEIRLGDVNFFDGKSPRLAHNGTNIGVIWTGGAGNLKVRWYDPTLAAQVGSDVVLINGVGNAHVGDAYFGPTKDGGPDRLLVSLRSGDSNMVRVFNSSMGRQTSEEFPRANNSTLIGMCYDSDAGNQRMVSFDKLGWMYTYSKYVDGGTLSAQNTLYDGDNSVYPSGTIVNGVDVSGAASGLHETGPSPLVSFTLSKRAWPTITAPPAPDELVTDVTQVDKANRLGIYAAINGTPRLQSYLAVGVRKLPQTDALSASGALAGSSGVQSFSNASVPDPGRIRSSALAGDGHPRIDLLGAGNGRTGPYAWGADGKPLNHGQYGTTNTGSIANSTWVLRTGFGIRENTNSPPNGITYGAGRFTVAQAGLYSVQGVLTIGSGANGRRALRIRKNDSSTVFHNEPPVAGGAVTAAGLTICTEIYLASGDFIEFHGYQTSGGSLSWNGNDEQNNIQIRCVAAYY